MDYDTSIIVLATVHLERNRYPMYAARLEAIIEEIRPDVICSELSPEQLAGSCSCDSKPEQRDIIMPWALARGIPIIPIQPPTEEGLLWERRKNELMAEVKRNEPAKYVLECLEYMALAAHKRWCEYMEDPASFEHLQLELCHIISEPVDDAIEHYMPELASHFTYWNEYFLQRILDAKERNLGKRILVCAGGGHKYWLMEKLKRHSDIAVHDLHSLRAAMNA
ncbi:MAG: hypothetical protein PHR28_09795 [candidate division Zixibacteria bacterium]|nr:hypothetical protein [candidate division Zixibacteria bacterium]